MPAGSTGSTGRRTPGCPTAGKLYRQMGNAIVAVAPGAVRRRRCRSRATVAVTDAPRTPPVTQLRLRLEEEIRKMIAAGHLKPGLFRSNIGDGRLAGNGTLPPRIAMDQGGFYFSNPGDTIYALVRGPASPVLVPPGAARAYIQSEMAAYPWTRTPTLATSEGTARQAAGIPPDYQQYFTVGKQTSVRNNLPWDFPMTAFYAAWKYAQVWPAEAARLYTNMRSKLTLPCKLDDAQLQLSPQMHNAYIAGYRGLPGTREARRPAGIGGRPAGVPAAPGPAHQHLLGRCTVGPDTGMYDGFRGFIMARQFLYLVPELARSSENEARRRAGRRQEDQ